MSPKQPLFTHASWLDCTPPPFKPAHLRCALAQLNVTTGACEHNASLIVDTMQAAAAQGSALLVTSELAIAGYPPEDLIFQPEFQAAHQSAFEAIRQASLQYPQLTVVVGHLRFDAGRCFNSASALRNGQLIAQYDKRRLPNYGVFDEQRYFSAGTQATTFNCADVTCALLICEDAWDPTLIAACAPQTLLLCLNASPYHTDRMKERANALVPALVAAQCAMVYVNQVGGQDDLLFDGNSFVCDAQGLIQRVAPHAQAALCYADFEQPAGKAKWHCQARPDDEPIAADYAALVLGLRDYVQKNNFSEVLLGLSGGVDSALVMALAVDALGADRVAAYMLPSPYTAQMSRDDAAQLALEFGVRYSEISIGDLVAQNIALLKSSHPEFAARAADTTEENLQARIRGVLLMSLSNKFGALLLATGNKSELATGYCTLYGDMCGGFAPIKDVFKTQVYALCAYRNQAAGAQIPTRILTRPPSAELRPDQTDQDSLAPYDILDYILRLRIEHNASAAVIAQNAAAAPWVEPTLKLLQRNEYKRRQGVIGTRISPRGLGRDWRLPQTNGEPLIK